MRLPAERDDAKVSNVLVGIAEIIPAIVGVSSEAQDRFYEDAFPLDRECFLTVVMYVPDNDLQFRSNRAFHPADRIIQRQIPRIFLANFQNLIPSQHARSIGRRTTQRSNHGQLLFDHPHANTDPPKLVLHSGAELIQILRPNIVGVFIEFPEDSLNRRFHQFATTHLLNIVPLHLIDRVGEQLQ